MVLVTGGAGVMGSALVRGLRAAGKRVRVLTLPGDRFVSRLDGLGVDIRYGDISRAETIEGICGDVDTVYHLAAIILAQDTGLFEKVNVAGTRHVAGEAAGAGVKHFVYVSSASVVYPSPTAYSLSKRAAEGLVRALPCPWTIVRPTLVYDKGRGGEEFDRYLAYLRRFPVVPFIGGGAAKKRPVFVGDIVEGLRALCDNKAALGKTYNFSGGETLSILDFSRLCLSLMGQAGKPIVRLPVWVCLAIAGAMKVVMRDPPLTWQQIAGITQDADLDPSEAQRDLGYCPARVSVKLPECFPRRAAG